MEDNANKTPDNIVSVALGDGTSFDIAKDILHKLDNRYRIPYDELHKVALYLYQIADDIDTVSDIAKGNDQAYRKMVTTIQKRKSNVLESCDGLTVVLKALSDEG